MTEEYYGPDEDNEDTSTNDEENTSTNDRDDDPADIGSNQQTVEDYGKYGEDRTNDNRSLYE